MKLLDKVNKAMLHCSASDHPRDGIYKIFQLHTLPKTEQIEWKGYMINCRGWEDIAYHYLIDYSGDLKIGRDTKYQGAGCYGQNHDCIHICILGDKKFTLRQYETFFKLKNYLQARFNLSNIDFYGHNDWDSNKTCPNIKVNLG